MSQDQTNNIESAATSDETNRPHFVVGIGASAGGLQSIEELLVIIRPGCDAAFVIIQHLAPDVVSLMGEILARSTTMQIRTIEDDDPIKKGIVYLVPPGFNLKLEASTFKLVPQDRSDMVRPVNDFFFSLANAWADKSIGVVMSGSGADGAEGIRAISEAGGTTLVESFESARFDSMPRSCVKTGCVDGIMSIPDIAEWLNQQFAATSVRPDIPNAAKSPEDELGINRIFRLLSERYDIDFSGYKPSTVSRRIKRRQQFCHIATINDYAEYAKENPSEVELLYHDLLIGVTKFFRDTDAFDLLQQQIEELVRKLPENETLRLWSAGCASGEEAFSIAMLVYEAFEQQNREPNFKLFATDVHRGLLEFASKAKYDIDRMEYVNEERIRKFFVAENADCYRVNTTLRRHVVFAHHNVFSDPPFTGIHLISCRNLLIYLTIPSQRRALENFHFSLVVDGILLLGPSESLGDLSAEFRRIDLKWKLFRKFRNLRLSRKRELGPAASPESSSSRRLVNFLNRDQPRNLSFTRLLDSYELVLQNLVQSAILLDENRQILHVFGEANQYLISQTGRFSGNLNDFLPADVRPSITAGLIRAAKQPDKALRIESLRFEEAESQTAVSLEIRALNNSQDQLQAWLVVFCETKEVENSTSEPGVVSVGHSDLTDVRELESELIYTKDSLNATIEELETSNEELQATNEELVASNEELQSTNEELQSVNEELYTVNFENRRRLDELQELTDDLEIILDNYEVGTIFLDEKLAIRKFTWEIRKHFDLMPNDIGREITAFRSRLLYPDFEQQLKQVRETGDGVARLVQDTSGEIYLVKIEAYRGKDQITGVIVNVIDRTKGVALGTTSKYSLPRQGGFWHWPDVKSDNMVWSPDCFELLSLEEDSIPPKFSSWRSLIHSDDLHWLEAAGSIQCRLVEKGSLALRMKCGDGEYRRFGLYAVFNLEDKDSARPGSMAGYIVPLGEMAGSAQ